MFVKKNKGKISKKKKQSKKEKKDKKKDKIYEGQEIKKIRPKQRSKNRLLTKRK